MEYFDNAFDYAQEAFESANEIFSKYDPFPNFGLPVAEANPVINGVVKVLTTVTETAKPEHDENPNSPDYSGPVHTCPSSNPSWPNCR